MSRSPGDNGIEIFFREEGNYDLVVEDGNYTVDGVVLDSKARVARDLTNVRIYMIDFGFDELESDTYAYIEEEIEKCRVALDEDELMEASVRVVCLQFLLGLQLDRITIVKGIINDKIPLPVEFFGEAPQKLLGKINKDGDETQKRLSVGFSNNTGSGDGLIKKRWGKK